MGKAAKGSGNKQTNAKRYSYKRKKSNVSENNLQIESEIISDVECCDNAHTVCYRNDADVAVCFICDDGYVMYTAVAITSIIQNKDKDKKYSFYIISSGLTEENTQILKSLDGDNCFVEIIEVNDPQKYDYLTKEGFPVTPAALFKFDLPTLLPHLDKVLYMDGDIIVQKCLHTLFETDVSDVYAGVIKDYRGLSLKGDFHERLKIKHEAYFNSGIMLLNLALMRENDIPSKLLDYRQNGINYYMDQDALNVVFEEKVKYLSFNYNFQMTCWRFMNEELISQYYYLPRVNDKYDLIKNAVVIHYTAEKPWVYYDGKCSEIWMHYYLLSPYRDLNLNRKSILTRCKTEADRIRIYQDRLIFPENYGFNLQDPPLITVVMPVYNAERFVNNALGSLKKQSLVDYEVICVNDASKDSSLEILKTLSESDKRIRVISLEENRGAGGARNIALEHAKGEYVTFLDADDVLPPQALERFYQKAKSTNADFIFAQTQFDNNKVLSSSYRKEFLPEEEVFAPDDVADYLLSITHGGPSGKCLKTAFIRKNKIKFPEIARSEDFFFFGCAMMRANRISGIQEPLYTVIAHANPNSLEHTKDETPLIFWTASKMVKEWMIKNEVYKKYERSFINSNVVRTWHNMKALTTFKGLIHLKEYFDMSIVKELSIFERDAEYFYETKCYEEMVRFSESTLEEVLDEFAHKKIREENKKKEVKPSAPVKKTEPAKKTVQAEQIKKTNQVVHDRNYWQGVSDTRASRTYLAGRVVTWLPKQIRAFGISLIKNGPFKTIVKIVKKIGRLPKAVGKFISVWKVRTKKAHESAK